MATDLPQNAVLFILATALAIAVTYYMQRRKIKPPVYVVSLLLLFLSITTFFVMSSEGNAIAALFLWFACAFALSSALDILTRRDRQLNEKLAISSMLFVLSGGSILTNLYIFSARASLVARIFSASMLILVHAPIVFALIAYLVGKKKLSKKLVNFGYLRRYEK